LLVERGDRSVVDRLASAVSKGRSPQYRLHALYTLDGLGSLGPEVVEEALADPHFALRVHALRLAERWLDARPALRRTIVGMVDDPDPSVRLQAGFTLGESEGEEAAEALFRLAAGDGAHPWIQAAVLSSSARSAGRLLREILSRARPVGSAGRLARPLASTVGARQNDEEIGRLLAATAEVKGERHIGLQRDCLEGLLEGLEGGKPHALRSTDGRSGLERLLVSPSAEVRRLAFQIAGRLELRDAPEMKATYARAAQTALDESQSVSGRRSAVGLLVTAPYSTLVSTVERLLDARQPLELQLAAVGALAWTDDPRAGEVLLSGWPGYTPKVQEAALEAVLSRTNRLASLLDAVEEGLVPAAGLSAVHREALLRNSDAEIRQRAESLLAGRDSDEARAKVLARYQAALKLERNPERGHKVYQEQCAKCHKLQDQGYAVGADLAATTTRTDETLIADILDPSRQLTAGYQNYTVVTVNGRMFGGVLAGETATSVILRKEEGAEQTILRKDVDQMEASRVSMMPEGLEKEVSPQDVADLIAYLREALGPVPPPAVTLFDDDPAFADLLTQGDGTARIAAAGVFSGSVSLAVTPPQRWNQQIDGWAYAIAENPGAGEFRYLRFAWKSPDGHGVMIELAADGRWPPAEEPTRRYYSGKNTTGWEAVEVSPEVPEEWVVVTRDLWRDFGSFTLTGIAPTAMGGEAWFDRIELLRTPDGGNSQ
ncbi:MAG: HEAT repeat domain-containing protein, partial [Planctomycetota bacterium]